GSTATTAPAQPQPAPSGGGDTTTSTTGLTLTTPPPTSSTTSTTTTTPCRNSQDARCGQFSWDPDPGPNGSVTVQVTPHPGVVHAGDTVFFDVVVDDPDHVVGLNCSQVRF